MNIALFINKLKLLWKKSIKEEKPFVYVALGDSTVEGIGASSHEKSYAGILHSTIKKHKKNVIYQNLGKHGAPIHRVINHQLDNAIKLQPDIITISVGANDLRFGTLPRVFEKRLRNLIDRIHAETNAKVIINTIPDFSYAPKVPVFLRHVSRMGIKKYNDVIIKVAKEKKVIHIDLFEHGTYYSQHFPEAIADDGFHPSNIGYAIWAREILSSMKPLLYTPAKA